VEADQVRHKKCNDLTENQQSLSGDEVRFSKDTKLIQKKQEYSKTTIRKTSGSPIVIFPIWIEQIIPHTNRAEIRLKSR